MTTKIESAKLLEEQIAKLETVLTYQQLLFHESIDTDFRFEMRSNILALEKIIKQNKSTVNHIRMNVNGRW